MKDMNRYFYTGEIDMYMPGIYGKTAAEEARRRRALHEGVVSWPEEAIRYRCMHVQLRRIDL